MMRESSNWQKKTTLSKRKRKRKGKKRVKLSGKHIYLPNSIQNSIKVLKRLRMCQKNKDWSEYKNVLITFRCLNTMNESQLTFKTFLVS
jgi:hypothetical protein